jgi:hypothetical protein
MSSSDRGLIWAIASIGAKVAGCAPVHSQAPQRIGTPHDQESDVPRMLTRPKRSHTWPSSAYTDSATTARSAGSRAAAPSTTPAPIEQPMAPIRSGSTSARVRR